MFWVFAWTYMIRCECTRIRWAPVGLSVWPFLCQHSDISWSSKNCFYVSVLTLIMDQPFSDGTTAESQAAPGPDHKYQPAGQLASDHPFLHGSVRTSASARNNQPEGALHTEPLCNWCKCSDYQEWPRFHNNDFWNHLSRMWPKYLAPNMFLYISRLF